MNKEPYESGHPTPFMDADGIWHIPAGWEIVVEAPSDSLAAKSDPLLRHVVVSCGSDGGLVVPFGGDDEED